MSAGAWGFVIGSGLMMYVLSLIFLGLLALIPPLQKPYAWRHVLAWLLGSLAIGYVTSIGGGNIWLVAGAALLCGLLMWVRYWWVTRKRQMARGSE